MSGRPIAFRAAPGRPCAVCASETKGCSATDDGLHLCRGEPGRGWKPIGRGPDATGFGHYRQDDGLTSNARPVSRRAAPVAPAVASPAPDWTQRAARYVANLGPAHAAEFARRLKLPEHAASLYPLLGQCGARSSGDKGARTIFTLPEFDGAGTVVGITERHPPKPGETREPQQMIAGGHRGLMLTHDWKDQPGPLFIVEGASDAIAARIAGLAAVGRPGADGGAKLLAELLAEWPRDRPIIVVAERDAGGAGVKGAEKLARALTRSLNRPVPVGYPPDGAKDTRAWLTNPARDGMPWPDRGAAFLAAVQGAALPVEADAAAGGKVGSSPSSTPAPGLVILVDFNERVVNDQAVQALSTDPDIYQRAGALVRPVESPASRVHNLDLPAGVRIAAVEKPTLRERIAHVARFQEEAGNGEDAYLRDVRPPHWCVDAVHARGYWPGVRNLAAVVDHPVVTPDGSVLTEPGYDAATELFLSSSGVAVELPADPDQADAAAAVGVLLDAVADVPFAEDTHRAAWVAALLTPLARFAFDGPAPLFLVDANVPGAGKGLICNLSSVIITGGRLAVASYDHDPAEMGKCITAAALSGDRLILLDNISGPFGNDAMDKALTSTVWRGRVLGESREVKLPLWLTWYATGNNIELRGDMGRRIVHVRLHSTLERPDERTDLQRPDLLEWAAENRPALLSAALTILAAYIRAGCPSQGLSPMGSFEQWSRVVRGAVVWAGLADPAEGRAQLRTESDPEVAAMATVLREWVNAVPDGKPITVARLVAEVMTDTTHAAAEEFREALAGIVKEPTASAIGYKFRRYAGRNLGGLILAKSSAGKGLLKWHVTTPDGRAVGWDVGMGGDHLPQSGKRSRVDTRALWGETSPPIPTSQPSDEPADQPPPTASPDVEAILADAVARHDEPSTRALADDVRRYFPASTDHALDVLNAARTAAARRCAPPD